MILVLCGLLWAGDKDKALIYQLDREVVALQQRIAALQTQLQNCASGSDAPAIYTELTQIFSGSAAKVDREGPIVRVTFPGDLMFSVGNTRVRDEAQPTLDLLSTVLKTHSVKVTVLVYTDSEPISTTLRKTYPTAWEWTSALASSVVRDLTGRYGVPPERLTAAGRADLSPVGSNDTPEGRAQNRRVVIEIVEVPVTPP